MIKKYSDELFIYLNWILKKTPIKYPEVSSPSSFLINRWLSMSDPFIAQLINLSANRWIFKTNMSKETTLINKFFRIFLPKKNSKIFYIKKEKNTNKNKEDLTLEEKNYSTNLELSMREINFYNKTLEDLKK